MDVTVSEVANGISQSFQDGPTYAEFQDKHLPALVENIEDINLGYVNKVRRDVLLASIRSPSDIWSSPKNIVKC